MHSPAPDSFTDLTAPECLERQPVVSVLMLAYNHEAWIAQAIEGVLAQRCDFDFELIIGEDCSTDGTRAIALDYQARHPERIRVVFPAQNGGSHANHRRIAALGRGEFVAYCEGDDYWCHPDKLAAQVALLRAHPSAAMVHADWVRAREEAGRWRVDCRPVHRRLPSRLLQGNLFPCFYFAKILRTCTVMQQRSALKAFLESPLAQERYRFVDTVRSAFFTAHWDVVYWPEIGAVYRESPNSALRSGNRSFIGFLRSGNAFDDAARRVFSGRHDYPASYRWENDIGLLLRGLMARDGAVVREALADLRMHYGAVAFVRAACQALWLRWPRLRANRRTQSSIAEDAR